MPEWRFPGRGRVQGQLNRAKSVLTRGEKLLHALPLRGKQAELSAKIETKRQEVERALEYVELYGLYTECEAIYQVDNLLAMWDRLDAADQATFNFDPRSVDWDHYVREIHLPSIVKHARVKTEPGKTTTDRTRAPAQAGAVPHPAHGGVRPREHAHRLERRRELLVDGDPAARPGRAAAVRDADDRRGAADC